MILKTMRTCSKNSFDHKCNYALFVDYRGGSRNFATSNMELFMTKDKCYVPGSVSRLCDNAIYWIGFL